MGWRCHTGTGEERLSWRLQWGWKLMRINNNIWTGVEYRRCLLSKRFYAAWLGQGLGTKVLAWNKENRNRVRRLLYVKDERIIVTWGQISMKQGCRNKGWNKGNRDEQRGVRDVMEIEQTWRWRRYSREEAAWDRLCQRSISDLISNRILQCNIRDTSMHPNKNQWHHQCKGNPWVLWRSHNHTGWQRGKPKYEQTRHTIKGISPDRGENQREKSLRSPTVTEPILYYVWLWSGPSLGTH